MSPKQSKAIEDLIQKVFGPDEVSFEYSFNGKKAGWLRHFKSASTWSESIPFVEKNWRPFAQENIRLFVGDGSFLPKRLANSYSYDVVYARPGLETISIIELAKVGIHNNSDDYWKDVLRDMKRIYEHCPFEIQFADEAGLQGTFLRKPTKQQAHDFGRLILEIDVDALDWIEGHAELPSGLSVKEWIPEYILRYNKFALWWD